jgi:hypothetical protein
MQEPGHDSERSVRSFSMDPAYDAP